MAVFIIVQKIHNNQKYQIYPQGQINLKQNSNNIDVNPNIRETQKTPLTYNQAIPNLPLNKQVYPSLFLPSHQIQGTNQIPFFR